MSEHYDPDCNCDDCKAIRGETPEIAPEEAPKEQEMPFKSKAQERAAFSGALGAKMKKAAPQWASETNQKALPSKVKTKKRK